MICDENVVFAVECTFAPARVKEMPVQIVHDVLGAEFGGALAHSPKGRFPFRAAAR